MAAVDIEKFRIGELARRVGATPRTVRYYEELGLLPDRDRPRGAHRLYDATDEARLRELLRIRDLLGLSLTELQDWMDGRGRARAAARAVARDAGAGRRHAGRDHPARRSSTSTPSWASSARGATALEELEDELAAKRRHVRDLLTEFERATP